MSDAIAREAAIDSVSALEQLIHQSSLNSGEARKALRHFLFSQAGDPEVEGSIGDALALLANSRIKDPLATIVVLRCLVVEDLVPHANHVNHIVRNLVELAESSVPEICNFIKLEKKSQNYEKFEALGLCHKRVTDILDPLRRTYGDLDALLGAKREILGSLNHSIIKQYGEPFRLKDTRRIAEAIFGKLKRVSALDATLLVDTEECLRSITNARGEAGTAPSFLTRDFLKPFLDTCDRAISEFLESLRGRFTTSIQRQGGGRGQLQKRQPLHEANRELLIAIPFRNSGPGMATDVRITASVSGENVMLAGETISLGNVLPGDFSVALDALVINPCTSVRGAMIIEWGEISNPIRKSDLFEFEILAQSSSIDWHSLEYSTPYSTDVAEGSHFIGREEKVRHLAAKLLRHPMEPFYITGQKRVGKTSLALAAVEFAKSNGKDGSVESHYILWGGHMVFRACNAWANSMTNVDWSKRPCVRKISVLLLQRPFKNRRISPIGCFVKPSSRTPASFVSCTTSKRPLDPGSIGGNIGG